MLSQAKSLVDEHQAKVEEGKSVADEIRRRQAAMKVMGFDSLYTAAWLEAHGPSPVESPLVLKPKEQAYVSVAAVLARLTTRTRYAGGSQGFSFPIGHTGIRYRVGSFNGHPVQSSSITDIDEGTIVLTNMRLAFIGKVKSVITQLSKVVHVESYNDALAVFQEGRESPNFYKDQRTTVLPALHELGPRPSGLTARTRLGLEVRDSDHSQPQPIAGQARPREGHRTSIGVPAVPSQRPMEQKRRAAG